MLYYCTLISPRFNHSRIFAEVLKAGTDMVRSYAKKNVWENYRQSIITMRFVQNYNSACKSTKAVCKSTNRLFSRNSDPFIA